MILMEGVAFFFSWEVSLIEWLQANLSNAGVAILSFFSMFGEELVLIFVMGLFYWCFDKKLGKTVGLSVLAGLTWGSMIKNVVLRRRPYFDHEKIRLLREIEKGADIHDASAQGYSMPSAHSANATALFGSMALDKRKKWLTVLAFAIPFLTGISRVAVGAHYPTDVLAGWALGALCALLVPALQSRIKSTPLFYGLILITVIPGLFFCKSADFFTGFGLMAGFMAGTLLEEKRVRFEETKKPLAVILRLVGGVTVYFALNLLLKLPFSKEFLENGTTAALLVRSARYAVIAFIEFGVYPMLFKRVKWAS